MNFVNLCPHPVTFQKLDANGRPHTVSIQPSRQTCRVSTENFSRDAIDGVPIQAQTFGEIYNLPDPEPNTVFIVSSIVLGALRLLGSDRQDVIAPATGPRDGALRDRQGNIAAVTRFNALLGPAIRQEAAA